jgi:hypothetical protein
MRDLYPHGIPLAYAQPIAYTAPDDPIFVMGAPNNKSFARQKAKIGLPVRIDPTERVGTTLTEQERNAKRWPLPSEAAKAGVTQEEWCLFAAKAWSDHFNGGGDGYLDSPTVGSFRWNYNEE